jgi:hypothetical protein
VAEQTWFRGEISGGPTAKTGGAVLHDFYDGVYLTDDPALAKEYMNLRLRELGLPPEKGRVVAVTFDPLKLGRVLDLRTDPRWLEYTTSYGMRVEMLYTQEAYSNTFSNFVKKYDIKPTDYAFVIGPEYVRRQSGGGIQICIVHPDGVPTDLSKDLRSRMRPVTVDDVALPPVQQRSSATALKPQKSMKVVDPGAASAAAPSAPAAKAPAPAPSAPKVAAPAAPAPAASGAPAVKVLTTEAVAKSASGPSAPAKPSGVTGVKLPGGGVADWSAKAPLPPIGGGPKSAAGKVLGNQDAAAMIGVALGSAIQSLGDVGIKMTIEDELKVKNRAFIERSLRQGDGVLVIIRMEQWKQPDFNGMKARALISVEVCSGPTEEQALEKWRRMPKLLKGGAIDWEQLPEQYTWIPPGGE